MTTSPLPAQPPKPVLIAARRIGLVQYCELFHGSLPVQVAAGNRHIDIFFLGASEHLPRNKKFAFWATASDFSCALEQVYYEFQPGERVNLFHSGFRSWAGGGTEPGGSTQTKAGWLGLPATQSALLVTRSYRQGFQCLTVVLER